MQLAIAALIPAFPESPLSCEPECAVDDDDANPA